MVAVFKHDAAGNINGLGTGTLIAPNVVLTAHHLVAEFTTPGTKVCETTFAPTLPPSQLGIMLATDIFPVPQADYFATAILVPPVVPGESEFCGSDLALLVFDEPVADVTPIPVRLADPVAGSGELYTEVGYGRMTANDPSTRGTRRRHDYVTVCADGEPNCIYPLDAREWLGSGGGCVGDSGGPALTDGMVAGVASHATPGCGEVAFVSVKAWTAWLDTSLRAIAADTGVPAPEWLLALPAGAVVCRRHAECPASELCASAGLCVSAAPGAACATDDDCGAELRCEPARGACVPRGFYDGEPWVAPVELGPEAPPEAPPEGQPELALVADAPATSGGDTSTTSVVETAPAVAPSDAAGCAGAADGAWGAVAGLALMRHRRRWRRRARARD